MRSAARPDTDASDPGGPGDDEEITVAATEEAEEEQPQSSRQRQEQLTGSALRLPGQARAPASQTQPQVGIRVKT